MKETPILFSTPMVKAILDGRKTQTRRVVKPQPIHDTRLSNIENTDLWSYTFCDLDWKCPFGKAKDKMWVREAHFYDWEHDRVFYSADANEDGIIPYLVGNEGGFGGGVGSVKIDKWKPSIHMFKKYARIWLEITNIRVERLQDISEEDSIAEGSQIPFGQLPKSCQQGTMTERTQFSRIWDSINSKKHPWSSNPWVWVIEFEMIDKETGDEG